MTKHDSLSKREPVPFLKRRSVIIAIMAMLLGMAFLGVPALVHAADPSGADTLGQIRPPRLIWHGR